MSSLRKLNRRSLVRIVSFTVALVLVLAASSISAYAIAVNYRTTVEYSYQRALSQLSEYVNDLNNTLDKGQYATTSKQIQGLSTKLCNDAGYAKDALAQLPVDNNTINVTNKFLSQVGNFCLSLSNRVSVGGKITDADLESLDKLSNYASKISKQLRQMVSDVENGRLMIGEVSSSVKKRNTDENEPDVTGGFKEIEEGFSDYPTMIYDGPFSDNILQQKPKLLKGKPQVSVDKALKTTKTTTKINSLKHVGDTASNLPTYDFTSKTMRVSVTKAGGLIDYFIDSRPVGEPKISTEKGVKIAQKVLTDMGFKDFKYRYYGINNGILTVNFAATQNGVILYPDLIKIGIALDDGSVVAYDAKGYIMNHTTRNLPDVAVTEHQARSILSKRLTVQSHDMAIIPTEGLSETLCHEFMCKGQKDEQVLVYVNVQTGMEEQILIVIKDEMGVLAI
ncbi:MAG: germination protein YpeB [Oscillospiraceae bacterium]|nr:germination protein YpeB [Oscillospiraceae bacterium]MDD4414420.1 germination protein YpeB [Oscillospiraceae bacterium]